jgi:hypothetical protein
MDVCPRIFCVVLPCVGLIPRPRSPTKCPNRFVSSEVKLLNRNKPLAYTLKDDDDDDCHTLTVAGFHQFRWKRHRIKQLMYSQQTLCTLKEV